MDKKFFAAVNVLQKEKKIPADALYEKIANAFVIAASRTRRTKDNIFCEIKPEEYSVNLYVRKTVVPTDDDVMDPEIEVSVGEAQKYRAGAIADDIVSIPLEIEDFGRIAAQTVKHTLRQGIREIEHDKVLKEYKGKEKEIVTAKVKDIDAKTNSLTLEIGDAEAILPKNEQIPGETYTIGQLLQIYIVEVRSTEKGPKVMISRTHPGFVKRLFEKEVPEIFDGTIEVKGVSREAGSRTKIAVWSKEENVDPVGSCIGQRGNRVSTIVNILAGEKIDIVKYSENPEEFVAAALAPAEILKVEVINESAKSCQVTVPDTQLSLAIGNKGQNARLAAKLTGWKIDIKPESGFYQPTIQL